jgi:DNA-binding transcriptional LysR family regulator
MANGPQIDYNLFVVLEAIYTEGNVTKAAYKLHLSQPAISHALARLRELFGDPLFVRKGSSMVPTPLTRNSIESIRSSLRHLEDSIRNTAGFDPALAKKRMTLCLPSSMETALLPALWQRLASAAPQIDLVANRGERQRLEARLASGAFDVAIDVLFRHSEEMHQQRILRDRLVVVVRRDHPHVQHGFTLETYLQQQHALVSSRRQGPGIVDVELSRLGLERRVRLRCQQSDTAFRIVGDSDLVLTMLEFDARAANSSFGHLILPLPIETDTIDMYLYWHSSVDNDPANRWLRNEVAAMCATLTN